MTAGLAVATATACFPVQPQGANPAAAAPSTSLSAEQASSGGPAGRDTNVADPTTLTDPMNDPYVL